MSSLSLQTERMVFCFRGGSKYNSRLCNGSLCNSRLYNSRLPKGYFWTILLVSATARFLTDCNGSAFVFVEASTTIPLGNEKATLASGAFNTSEGSHRQDVCDRYEAIFNNNNNNNNSNSSSNSNSNTNSNTNSVGNALSGMQVTVSITPGDRFVYNDTKGIDPIYPGIEAKILDHIAREGNFTWRNSFGVWDRKEIEIDGKRSYTDFLLWGTETFDVVVLDVTPTAKRMNLGISFTLGQVDSSLIMVRNGDPESPKVNWLRFIEPFEYEVWFAIAGVVVLSSIAYQFIEQLGMDRNPFENSFRDWVMTNLYRSVINFTGNYSYEPTTLGGRIFGVFFAFWAMLILAAYTANLASILVKENYRPPEIRNLQDAIAKNFRICVQVRSAAEEFLKQKYHSAIDELLVSVEKEDMYKALQDDESNSRCEITVTKKQEFQTARWQEEFNPSCRLEWQGRMVASQTDSFATKHSPGIKCTDLINEVFSYHMQKMQDNGVLKELWDEHEEFYKTEGHCLLNDDDDDDFDNNNSGEKADVGDALSVKDMAGTMLVQFVGSLIAIVVAFLSRKEERTSNKRRLGREANAFCAEQGFGNSKNDDNVSAIHEQVGGLLGQLDCLADYSCRLEGLAEKVETMQESIVGKQRKHEIEDGHCPFDEVEKVRGLPPTGIIKMRHSSMIGDKNLALE